MYWKKSSRIIPVKVVFVNLIAILLPSCDMQAKEFAMKGKIKAVLTVE